jgi:hypothetical protein
MSPARLTRPNPTTVRHGDQPAEGRLVLSRCFVNRSSLRSPMIGLAGSGRRFPWWTAGAAGTLFASRWVPMPGAVHGWITLAYCLSCLTLLIPDSLSRTGFDGDREATTVTANLGPGGSSTITG